MSCIDKTYVSSWEEWKELKDWVWDKKIELKNGLTCYPRNCMYYPDYDEKQVNEWLENVRQSNMKMYGYTYDVAVERSEIPFWNTPTYVDIWLIKNCPIEWVQDRLKYQYGGDSSIPGLTHYDTIKQGISEYDTYKRNGLGKNFKYKVIKKPTGRFLHKFHYIDRNENLRLYKDNKNSVWLVEVNDVKHPYNSDEYIHWCANDKHNFWTCYAEALPYTSSAMTIRCKQPSLKSIIRRIQKWDLPDGTQIKFANLRFNIEWIIIIKKK